MLFNSWGYILVFLILGTVLYWGIKPSWRVYLLGVGGIVFYCFWRWEFVFLMLLSPSLDYICANQVYKESDSRKRKTWLYTTLGINLGLLFFFKYTYFTYGSIQFLSSVIGGVKLPDLAVNIILPLGISFYTFHSISYTIDVYRGTIRPINHFPTFLAYVAFWPQLMAGPILRPGEVLPQLKMARKFNTERFASGVERIIFGLFKKVVIADNIALAVDNAFAYDFSMLTAFDVWIAAFLFGFQIYFDFSGYSDMAIGSARLLGIEFPENFNWPYSATSPRDFWKRWHISLSSWIRDYLYLPLIGQKYKTTSTGGIAEATVEDTKKNTTYALFATWFIMGLWHGASWTFACWGIYHALFIWIFRKLKFFNYLENKTPLITWGITLLISMAGWIFFRASSLDQAFSMYSKIINPNDYILYLKKFPAEYYYSVLLLVTALSLCYIIKHKWYDLYKQNMVLQLGKYAIVSVMITSIILYISNKTQFIYFQF